MRTTIRTIAAMSAAILALVSCSKENLIGNGKKDNDGARVISLSLAQSTKTVLGENGITPKFVEGDVIKLSDGSKTEDCTVKVKDDVPTISTTLSGALTAIYPAAASTDGQTFTVSTSQSGKFSDANICKATIAAGASIAEFQNQTAILRFYVDKSIGVKSITVTSSESNIAYDSKTITVNPEGETTIDNVTDDSDKRICYVAVLPGAATKLTFSSVTTTQDSYTDNTVERTTSSLALSAGKMYNAFIPYYIKVKVKDSPETYQKWGYCNVGAFLPEEYGDYFAWGEIVGHKYVDGSWTNFPEDNPDTYRYYSTWDGDKGFAFNNINSPYFDDNDFDDSKYNSNGGKTVLELSDDAARANWGGSWRMPTKNEYDNLLSGTGTTKNDFIEGVLTIKETSLIFPAAGYGRDMTLNETGKMGDYWSSSLNAEDAYTSFEATTLEINHTNIRTDDISPRPIGSPVRAILD